MILDDTSEVKAPPQEVMPFWRAVMTSYEDVSPGTLDQRPIITDL